MNRMKQFLLYTAAALTLLGTLSACQDAEYSPLTGRGYISQTQTRSFASQVVTVGHTAVTTDMNIRVSDPVTEDVSFKVASNAKALEAYNARYSTNYVLLDETQYSITDSEGNPVSGVSIAKDQNMSPSLRIQINPMTEQMQESGQKYALALTATSADGKVPMIESASSMVYILDRIPIQPVPVINYSTAIDRGKFNGKAESFTQWTWETNVNMDLLGEGIGQLNNQYIFNFDGSGEIYIRFGDAPIDGRVLQIKTQGTQMNSQMMFSKNTWYHIAFVCTGNQVLLYVNGQLDNTLDVGGETYLITPGSEADFSMCNTTYFRANAMFAEMRFWNVARSQAEIQNNMYSCDPTTPGLLCYFRFNEGKGGVFYDATWNNEEPRAWTKAKPSWRDDVRIDGKE